MEATYAQIQKKPSAAAATAVTATSSQSQYPETAGQDYNMQQPGQGYSPQQIDGNNIKLFSKDESKLCIICGSFQR